MEYLNLTEIRKGIWSFTNEEPRFEHEPIVLVHPFFQWDIIDGVFDLWGNGATIPTVYETKLKQTITEYSGSIILLEPERSLKKVAEGIRRFRSKESYFVSTEPASPLPIQTDLESLIDFIVQFSGDPIKLGGGYLWNKDWGCLGVFGTLLKKMSPKSTRYIEGLIFEGLG